MYLPEYKLLLQSHYYDTVLQFDSNQEIRTYMDFLTRCFYYFDKKSNGNLYSRTENSFKLIIQTKIIKCRDYDTHKKLFGIIMGQKLLTDDFILVSELMIKYEIKEFPYMWTKYLLENIDSIKSEIVLPILNRNPKPNNIHKFLIWLLTDNDELKKIYTNPNSKYQDLLNDAVQGIVDIIESKIFLTPKEKNDFIKYLQIRTNRENKRFPKDINIKLHAIVVSKKNIKLESSWANMYEFIFNRMDGLAELELGYRKHWAIYVINKLPAPYFQRIVNKLLWDMADIGRKKLIVEVREHKYGNKQFIHSNKNPGIKQDGHR